MTLKKNVGILHRFAIFLKSLCNQTTTVYDVIKKLKTEIDGVFRDGRRRYYEIIETT